MTKSHRDLDALLDRVAGGIRRRDADASEVAAAAGRVWSRLRREAGLPADGEAPASTIRGCDDFRSLIPGYLARELAPDRSLLLEDHLSECVGCRRDLNRARGIERRGAAPAAAPGGSRSWLGWGLATAAAVGLVAVGLMATRDRLPWNPGRSGTIEVVEGKLLRVAGPEAAPLAGGGTAEAGRWLRTGRDSGAVVRLADGSRVELGERAEVSFTEGWRDTTVRLARGSIIVEASPQGSGHLNVVTDDCRVSVTGTIFAVNRGLRGSRVSVIEGEVHVAHGRETSVLLPGDQVATSPTMEGVPITEEIAWSREEERYRALLRELAELGEELDRIPRPGPRHETRLLDLVPGDTLVYGGVPNLTVSLVEAYRVVERRAEANPALYAWWSEAVDTALEPHIEEALARLDSVGRLLGEEIVFAVRGSREGGVDGVLVLATLTDPDSFRELLREGLATLESEGVEGPVLRLLDGPPATRLAPPGEMPGLFLWITGDLLVVDTNGEGMRRVAGALQDPAAGSFRSSVFRARLAASYREGTDWIFGVRLGEILESVPGLAAQAGAARAETNALRRAGLLDLEDLIVESRETPQGRLSQAVLSFDRERRGVASWLGRPGPLGSLDFVSPDAHLAAAAVVKAPEEILEDLGEMLQTRSGDFARALREFERTEGLDLAADVARPLGGEFAFALDGPVVPTPSWIAVVEVEDPVRLQDTLEWAVARLSRAMESEGLPPLRLESRSSAGRTVHVLTVWEPLLEVHYTVVDGYLVAASSGEGLERARRNRAAGVSLSASPRFRGLLHQDAPTDVSALLYQNVGDVLGPTWEGLARSLAPEGPESERVLAALNAPASLAYAYAESNRITFATVSDETYGVTLARLLGFGGILSTEGDPP